jgi:glutaredoxin 3
MTGQRSVPNIFIKKQHIGGNSELQSLKSAGKLEGLLRQAGAL